MILRFFKGIIVGIGGVAPGLSGSVLLIIFGMYRQTLEALGSLMKDFRKNIAFLLPLVAGMILGVLAFSKVIDFCLRSFEMPTRFCFLGLIVGTLPMVWQEVKKEGFSKGYYFVILLAFALGIWFFTANPNAFPQVTNPNLLQKILLGAAVAMTAIVPGVDPAVFLSTLGLYLTYVTALATFDVSILLPMLIGVAGVSGIVLVVVSLALAMVDNVELWRWDGTLNLWPVVRPAGLVVLSAVAAVLGGILLVRRLYATRSFDHIALRQEMRASEGFTGVVSGLESLVGEKVVVFTDMKPSGKAKTSGGHVYEAVLKYGGFASKGEVLRVTGAEQGRIYCEKL